MKASVDRIGLLGIPLAAAIAIFPLVLHGPSYGHDFDFHLLNWLEAARQFGHGTLYPRWAYSPAYNAGEPRFVFYPPLSWVLGALVGLTLTHIPGLSVESAWAAVPIVYTWICLTASGFTMYRLARVFASSRAALAASILYLVNPYMLFTAYERTAYAELLAAAWIPLLLAAMLRERLQASRIAVVVALLWLTNVPAAVIGCYAVGMICVIRMLGPEHENSGLSARFLQRARTLALPTATGALLGVGLAGFYFVPAAWEQRFIQVSMAVIAEMRIDHNFLFEHTGTSPDSRAHDAVLRTASWIAVALLIASVILILDCWKRQRRERDDYTRPLPIQPLLWLLAIAGFLLTSASEPIWGHAPELAFLQFPWRLLALIAPIFALCAAVALTRRSLNRWTVSLFVCIIAISLTGITYKQFHQISDPDETVSARLHAFQHGQGFDPTDEYTPQTADNDSLESHTPAYWLARDVLAPAPISTAGITPKHFSVITSRPQYLILNLRDYPAWSIEVNGRLNTERMRRADGRIALPVAAGTNKIDIEYRRMSDESVGDILTLGAVVIVGVLQHRRRLLRT